MERGGGRGNKRDCQLVESFPARGAGPVKQERDRENNNRRR